LPEPWKKGEGREMLRPKANYGRKKGEEVHMLLKEED